jgi:hypothetical protein
MKKLPVLKIAVVGHTNTGKTSLMRTLAKDFAFGDIANRPATTRHVEGTSLLIDGVAVVELYDTPGLEDSVGLLEHLDSQRKDRYADRVEQLTRFLNSPIGRNQFDQEAKVIRQVLASDVAVYVVDARDRVRGKHWDELEILGRCAKPVLPILNFVASPEAKTTEWRQHLARLSLYAVAEFDTVVFNENGEQRLFEKMQTLLDPFHDTLAALIENRKLQRGKLIRTSADLLADLLIDVAAYRVSVPANGKKTVAMMENLKQAVREREQRCVKVLLELHRFRPDDYAAETLPFEEGQWGLDLFNPASLKQFGIRAGSGAAAGGMAGLAIDAMLGGASLGAGAAAGAAIGAIWSTARTHGRRIADRARGFTELRVSDATLRLLAVRQIALVQALLRRGHASQDRIRMSAQAAVDQKEWAQQKFPKVLARAKVQPKWSRLEGINGGSNHLSAGRLAAEEELARLIEAALSKSAQ